MKQKELICDLVSIFLIITLVLVPSMCFFFLEGGQIDNINYNSENIPKPNGENINGLAFTTLEKDFEPTYDGTKIIKVEPWQLPLRDILMTLITKHMAYIPPSFSKLLSIFYLALGLCLFILYRQKTKKKERAQESRREIIYQAVLQNSGINQQGIVDKTGLSRGSVRYHLTALLRSQEIVTAEFAGHTHYMVKKADVSIKEQLLLISLSEKKSATVLFCLWKYKELRIAELAEYADISPSAMRWRIKRLEERGLILREEKESHVSFYLSEDIRDTLKVFLPEKREHT